ncbi:MAG: ABC transporter ATP-binding protein [Deltaproteobacteria bacterium RBG_13_61_14]|nr:MAG: ABC transporter ATP-binding protein [Deltaproteobacteria bacterium RBG_13_61_14]
MTLLSCEGLTKRFDGIKALSEFSCAVKEGETIGLIGPNGAGKTTLFNVLTGFIPADGGAVHFQGKGITGKAPYRIARMGIARTFQILRLIKRLSVLENALLCFQDQPGERLGSIFFRSRQSAKQEAANREKAVALLKQYGLGDKLHDLADALSYGQQKLLSLVCCLAAGADLILLDEPVAGIAPEMIEKILEVIKGLPGQGKTVILIEHNMEAIGRVCDRVIFMDAGEKVCEGTMEEVKNDPRVIEAYLD